MSSLYQKVTRLVGTPPPPPPPPPHPPPPRAPPHPLPVPAHSKTMSLRQLGAARRSRRQRYPGPFYWLPFDSIGAFATFALSAFIVEGFSSADSSVLRGVAIAEG